MSFNLPKMQAQYEYYFTGPESICKSVVAYPLVPLKAGDHSLDLKPLTREEETRYLIQRFKKLKKRSNQAPSPALARALVNHTWKACTPQKTE